ncbi:MAG TPA: hypothetical protein PLW39_13490 [Thermoflexales bacterium]|nr:hypothetical protein [Thermoflexales bacterium]HQW35139.1 hypothetical protein [Thermoflexales bacterium]HQZ23274.1 hypothetical protein [Thermoflexales bacterium]
MRILIGIDDTDNLESRGTGHCARQLAFALAQADVAAPDGITRHQLLVDPRIPYTSHNSSACITATCQPAKIGDVISLCREFLLREAASGSDVGLCVARREQAESAIQRWGNRAKTQVLVMADALALAAQHDIHLEGLTGTRGGVIGSLAAVGLRAAGNDGRYLWLPGLRELGEGIYTSAQLKEVAHIDDIQLESGQSILEHERILIGDWPRPILRGGKAVLLAQEEKHHGEYEWVGITRERVKELTG